MSAAALNYSPPPSSPRRCLVLSQRGNRLWIANVGDSRAVLVSRRSAAVPLSYDHKPNRPEERRRIAAAGGRVVSCFGVPRVNGVLAVSRAFGDRHIRPTIRADPEITERRLVDGDSHLVIASDGLWDVLTNQEAADVTLRCADAMGLSLTACAEQLTTISTRKGSQDNTTALVVDVSQLAAAAAAGGGGTPPHTADAGIGLYGVGSTDSVGRPSSRGFFGAATGHGAGGPQRTPGGGDGGPAASLSSASAGGSAAGSVGGCSVASVAAGGGSGAPRSGGGGVAAALGNTRPGANGMSAGLAGATSRGPQTSLWGPAV